MRSGMFTTGHNVTSKNLHKALHEDLMRPNNLSYVAFSHMGPHGSSILWTWVERFQDSEEDQ